VFKEGSFFMVQIGRIGEENIEWILGRQRNKPEVIGNLYENPELLSPQTGHI